MIKKLKLKRGVTKIDFKDMVLHSQLGSIFSENVAIDSLPLKNNENLIQPAQIILSDKALSVSVSEVLLEKKGHQTR